MINKKLERIATVWWPARGVASFLATLILAGCGGGDDQQAPVTPPAFTPTYVSDTLTYDGSADGSLKKVEAIEQSAVNQNEVIVDGKSLTYVTTAGHLNITDPTGVDPVARMFYTAYTAMPDAGTRPITFFYNGGPGSSSVWLHLGSFAPKRIQVNAPNYYSEANKDGVSPQFSMVQNSETILATSDLVFVDAIATGYSQAVEPKKNIDFWSTDADASAFRDFVIRYLVKNNRQSSPFYLAGESYGGPRTAVLSRLLAERGYFADGIILISPILNYNSNCSKDSSTGGTLYISCIGFVPTYAAMIAHHFPERLPQGKNLTEYLEGDVVPYVENTYAPALRIYMDARKKLNSIPDSSTAEKAVAEAELDAAKIPMNAIAEVMSKKYGVEIVRSKGMPYNPKPVRLYEVGGTLSDKELGRYDSRIAVPADSKWAKDGDPASTLLYESYAMNIKERLSADLNYSASSIYGLKTNDNWTFSHQINGIVATENPIINEVDTLPDIKVALKLNPKMKIFAASGYSDMATPFYLTKLDLDRLIANERKNLTIKNYEGGHMMYLTNTSRSLLKSDLEAFYRASAVQ